MNGSTRTNISRQLIGRKIDAVDAAGSPHRRGGVDADERIEVGPILDEGDHVVAAGQDRDVVGQTAVEFSSHDHADAVVAAIGIAETGDQDFARRMSSIARPSHVR